jgi:DNA-binding ferritin-like protein (Dps family)
VGLFGPREQIFVSSVVYNMAGDYEFRTNYLKYLVLNGVLSNTGKSVGDVIVSGTLNGPRMNYRSFFRWAKQHYPEGMPLGGVFGASPINPELIEPYITVPVGSVAVGEQVILGFADYWNWAEEYMVENHFDLLDSDWMADIDEVTFDITITFEDTTTHTFSPVNYDPDGKYIYARYSEKIAPVNPDPVFVSEGPVLGPYMSDTSLPSRTGFYSLGTVTDVDTVQSRHSITRVLKTYSDGRPAVLTETKTEIGTRLYDRETETFERHVLLRPDAVDADRSWWDIERIAVWEEPAYEETILTETDNVVEIEPGVFENTNTKEIEEEFLLTGSRFWGQESDWEKDNGYKGVPKMFLYKLGTGNVDLDALESLVIPMDGYFPMIPVRTNNKMIDEEPHLTNIYPIAKKAWKRASGGKKIDKLIEQVQENPDLSDIDYAFIVWGVPLNTFTREGKLYIYKFFQNMMANQTGNESEFDGYLAEAEAYKDYLDALEAWKTAGEDPQTAPPVVPAPLYEPQPIETTVRTNGQHPETAHYDFRITWNSISEEIILGQWQPGARLNSVKIKKGDDITVQSGVVGQLTEALGNFSRNYNVITLYWQESATQYRKMKVIGARHKNVVYRGKSVDITSSEALDDGDDSGFLIPLHMSTLKNMPIVWANQLCLEGMHIVFNCYVVVKKKWYQTFLGQILIALVTMGLGAIFSGGASVLGGAGLLGSNVAVGAMFGLTGMAGAIAGAAINAIVMTTVMAVIQEIAAKLGPLGAIFAAIAGIVMGGMVAGQMTGQGFSFDIFLRADNLLKLTNATINAYSLHTQAKTQDIYGQMRDLDEQYKKQKREIDALMYEFTGFSSGFDPTILTEVLKNASETRDAFNQRTLMTGSDIAELTQQMIGSFANSSLDLESLKG